MLLTAQYHLDPGALPAIDNVTLTSFRPLSNSECLLLYTVWEIQRESGDHGTGVTRKEIAERLGKTENRISGIIHKIQPAASSYLIPVPHPVPGKVGKKGHPLNYYHLNHAKLATIPETARMLLELSVYPSKKDFRINRNEFVAYLVQTGKIKESEADIQKRIAWAIENSYLYGSDGGDFIWPRTRIDCERDYLTLIANYVA